jgi:hypothetical protein
MEKCVIVVQGLHMLDNRRENTIQFLKWMWNTFEEDSFVLTVQLDCLKDSKILANLEFLCTTSIHVLSNRSGTLSARITIRPTTPLKFQASFDVEHFSIQKDGSLKAVQSSMTAQLNQMALDPTADLTFNLKLTDDQRMAKDSLLLPYMHKQETFADQSKTFNIDEDDDFDDEDPDYDLEI